MNKTDKIGILGFGVEGKSTAQFLEKKGYSNITILDENQVDTQLPSITGKDIWNHLTDFDVIFRSPGISPLKKELQESQKQGVTITSHTELFFDLCTNPIIGITGTKGKGTTSSLLKAMIDASGQKCFLGGNIGTPCLDFVDDIQKGDKVILELSSFQTFTLTKSPHIAIILMTTQEHLDYHKDVIEYRQAKAQLIKHQTPQDICIHHKDFDGSLFIAAQTKGQQIPFSPDEIKNKTIFYKGEEILKTSEVALVGKHNLNNVLATLKAAEQLNLPKDAVKKALQTFSGLPMRIEKIHEKDNVSFFNDSFSTTPETTIAALQSFKEKHVYVLLGGSSKDSDFSDLYNYINQHSNIHTFCYGRTGTELQSNINNASLYKNLEEAFKSASIEAKKTGGVILLSPACASFDNFKNYKERGDFFNTLSLKA